MRRTLYVVAVMHCIVRFICDFNLFFFSLRLHLHCAICLDRQAQFIS